MSKCYRTFIEHASKALRTLCGNQSGMILHEAQYFEELQKERHMEVPFIVRFSIQVRIQSRNATESVMGITVRRSSHSVQGSKDLEKGVFTQHALFSRLRSKKIGKAAKLKRSSCFVSQTNPQFSHSKPEKFVFIFAFSLPPLNTFFSVKSFFSEKRVSRL